jgi:DNA-binding MarR family transcriptional regulator
MLPVPLRFVESRSTKAKAAIPTVVHEAQVTTLINLAARLTGKAARKRMGSIGAWPGQIPLLLWLLEKKQLVQKELVQVTGMEQSTVAEHLERMERDRLVTRRRGSEDRRQYSFTLTRNGRETARRVLDQLETGAQTFTRGIRQEDLRTFTNVLRQIIERLDAFVREPPKAASSAKKKTARKPTKAAA